MRFSAFSVVAAMCLAPSLACAEGAGFYLGLGLGQAEQEAGAGDGMVISIVDPFFGGSIFLLTPESVEQDGEDTSRDVVAGYKFNRFISAELSYVHFGESTVTERYVVPASRPPTFPAEIVQSYTSQIRGPAVSVLGTLPLGNWDLFARAGWLFADQDIDYFDLSQTFGSDVWLAGVGAGWNVTPRWTLRAQYERSDELDANQISGKTKLERWSLGVLFRFGGGSPAP